MAMMYLNQQEVECLSYDYASFLLDSGDELPDFRACVDCPDLEGTMMGIRINRVDRW